MKRLALALLVGCAPGAFDRQGQAIPGRDDLALDTVHVHVHAGLSDEFVLTLPDGAGGALIEVRGNAGEYRLAQLVTPSGNDLVESGGFVTRDARQAPGLVDWLFPNTPSIRAEAGAYRVRITALDGAGAAIDDDLEVRLYVRSGEPSTAHLHVDFLVADGALADADVDSVVQLVSRLYAQAGIDIADYTVVPVAMPGDVTLSTPVAPALGSGRQGAVHIVVVRSIDDGGAPLAGYALGLPGPFDADRPNAAVLVATAPFASPSTGHIDLAGLAATCAHEMGHYLGLYHTSERDGMLHDPIPDTPECSGNGGSACPDADNIMFWTGGATRHVLSEGQASVLRRHPLSQASAGQPPPPGPPICDPGCTAPDVCVQWSGQAQCMIACDPNGDPCPTGYSCLPSEDYTYVCGPN
jgi:hypothetical protein